MKKLRVEYGTRIGVSFKTKRVFDIAGRGGHRPTLLGVPPPVSVRGGLGGGVGDYAQPVRDRDNRLVP